MYKEYKKIKKQLIFFGILTSLLFYFNLFDFNPIREELNKNITEEAKEASEKTRVSYVVDGDTIEIESGKRVRLIGINTPEKNEYYFEEATNKMKELLSGREVILVKDISEFDKYGRLLRYVYVDGVFVNELMVSEGYAEAVEYYPDLKYRQKFNKAELYARSNKLGIWFK